MLISLVGAQSLPVCLVCLHLLRSGVLVQMLYESHTDVNPTLKMGSFSVIFWQPDGGRKLVSHHLVGLIRGNNLDDAPRAGSEVVTSNTCDFPMFSRRFKSG